LIARAKKIQRHRRKKDRARRDDRAAQRLVQRLVDDVLEAARTRVSSPRGYRSKITIVSLMEKPMIVRMAATMVD